MTNFEKIKEDEEKSKAAAAAAKPSSGLQSEAIFAMMGTYLDQGHGAPIVKKVNAVLGFDILAKKGQKKAALSYTIDLKNGGGKLNAGKPKNPDAVFTMVDGDFATLCKGDLNPQVAFMQGKMKIKGNMAAASRFTPDLFPAPTPENMAKFSGAKM